MKKFYTLILTLLFSGALFAQTFTNAGINYNVTSQTTAEVGKNYSVTGAVIIPNTVINGSNTYQVTNIGSEAFNNSLNLTSISIPNSVTNIGYYAFAFCKALTTVNLPNSVTNIGANAFFNCRGLTSVTIPNSVTNISEYAFGYCMALTSISIPNSVTSISEFAFVYCNSLTSISIPNLVTNISGYIFSDCSKLTSVSIPNSVTNINGYAFYNCTSLTSVIIPNVVTYIGSSAFGNCEALTSVNIPNSVKTIATGAFKKCTGLTSLTIGNSVTSIEGEAFMSCTNLTSVRIPNSVGQIESSAFSNCTSLKSVTVERARPISIVSDVFYNVQTASATLYVPVGTAGAYQEAPVWRLFGTITEGILPLTLTSLTAKSIAVGNQINWASVSIVNVKSITLERSGNNNNFSALATLPANATQFVDNNPLVGDNYYRLSSADYDGATKTYEKIALVKGLVKQINFYPNPAINELHFTGLKSSSSVTLFNLEGKNVLSQKILNSILQIPASVKSGVYIMHVKTNDGSITILKVLITK